MVKPQFLVPRITRWIILIIQFRIDSGKSLTIESNTTIHQFVYPFLNLLHKSLNI